MVTPYVVHVLHSASARRYPAIVLLDLVRDTARFPAGHCQARNCQQATQHVRLWLHHVTLKRSVVPHVNGVRYCAVHARLASKQSGVPLLETPQGLSSYHAKVAAFDTRERNLQERQPAEALDANAPSVHSPIRTPLACGCNGSLFKRSDGSLICVMLDDSVQVPCCYLDALRRIDSDTHGDSVPVHCPDCPHCDRDAGGPIQQ